MNKRYEISITEIAQEETITGREWVRGGVDGKENDDDEWGYTPQIAEVKAVTRQIYKQNVDELDLGAVIAAVNGF